MNKKLQKYKKERDYFSRHASGQKGKGTKPIGNFKYWLIILPVCAIILSLVETHNYTLYDESDWWYPLFFLIGLIVGIVKLKRDKDIVWNWKEYLGGAFYSFLYAMGLLSAGAFLFGGIEWLNYHIPVSNPCHEEGATILEKYYNSSYRRWSTYSIRVSFDNEKFGVRLIDVSRESYEHVRENGECRFVIQDGWLGMPIIKDIVYK